MKNLSRKLMLSIVAIALVVIALGTSTFAWFTLSNKAAVGQFNAEVTAGEGMELSLDGTTWYSTIPSTVMQEKIATLFGVAALNTALEPILTAVTTTGLATTAGAFKRLDLITANNFVDAVKNVHFIEVNIQVRAIALDEVYLSSLSVTGTPKDWISDAAFAGAKGAVTIGGLAGTVNVDAANGARVGFLGTESFVFENKDSLTNSVLGNDLTAYAALGQAAYFKEKTGVEATSFAGAPSTVVNSATTIAAEGEKILTLTTALAGETYNTGNFDLFVWFEGFDPDTFDSILKMPLFIEMSFMGKKTPVIIP